MNVLMICRGCSPLVKRHYNVVPIQTVIMIHNIIGMLSVVHCQVLMLYSLTPWRLDSFDRLRIFNFAGLCM